MAWDSKRDTLDGQRIEICADGAGGKTMPQSKSIVLARPHFVARILGLFGAMLAHEVTISQDLVTFRRGNARLHASFRNMTGVKHRSGLLYSTLEIETGQSSMRFIGLHADDAVHLELAILGGLDAWINSWWNNVSEEILQEIQSLTAQLDAFVEPDRYYQRSWFENWTAEATRTVSTVPTSVSDRAIPVFREFLNAVLRIREFLLNAEGKRKAINERFVQDEIERSISYFDCIEGRPLTLEQRLAIVTDEDSNLIVAAAGSGKTSVIVGKLRWLIDRGYRRADDILMLVFAKNAENEMKDRTGRLMQSKRDSAPRICTFHGLGYSIVGEVEGKKPSVTQYIDEKKLRLHIRQIIAELMKQKPFARVMNKWFQEYFAPYRSEHEFKSWGDYWEYLKKYDIRSLKGDRVRSFQECEIANFLFLHGIEYEYEKTYEHETATKDRKPYQPDFYLTKTKLYIEHLALNRNNQTPSYIDCDKYLEDLDWKRKLHDRYGTRILETYSWWQDDRTLLQKLERMLKEEGVKFSPVSSQQVFERLKELHHFDPFTDKIMEFLKHFKEQGLGGQDLPNRFGMGGDKKRDKAFAAVFLPIYDAYEKELKKSGDVDFSDMVKKAADYVERGKYRSPYRYILVDEFQDISEGRRRLLKALIDSGSEHGDGKCQLFAVGDDWQSIYRFAGSDISIMQNFEKVFGFAERRDLTTTFRCSQRIVDISRNFILKNQVQISKAAKSYSSRVEHGLHICYPAAKNDDSLLEKVLASIVRREAGQDGETSVLLLGRYRHQRPDSMKILQRKFEQITLEYRTIHSAKGCEADYVAVLSMGSGNLGFPSGKQSDSNLNMILSQPEAFQHAEERRLFYVAMTRARKSVYLLSEYSTRSEFVEELVSEYSDVEMHGLPPSGEAHCPVCKKGRLMYRQSFKNEGKPFWGCSNYPYCENIEKTCTECGRGVPVRKDDKFECSFCSKTFECCPASGCDGWLDLKIGKYGPFWGCSTYPTCSFTRDLRRGNRKNRGSAYRKQPRTRDR